MSIMGGYSALPPAPSGLWRNCKRDDNICDSWEEIVLKSLAKFFFFNKCHFVSTSSVPF